MRRLTRTLLAVALATVGLMLVPSPVSSGSAQRIFYYSVETRGETHYSLDAFARDAATIYADMRGLNLGGSIRFQRDGSDGDFNLVLASPSYIDSAAAVCDEEYSCRVGNDVLINSENWRNGTPEFDGPLDTYRRYLLQHETGHFLGLDHDDCPGGGPAPLMMQQSKGTGGCVPNGFPLGYEKEAVAARHGVRVLRSIPLVVQRPPIVPTETGNGYWVTDVLGDVVAFGDAPAVGDVRDFYTLDTGVVAAAPKADGGLYLSAFGGELYALDSGGRSGEDEVGSTSSVRLRSPIVGMAADPDGRGYWQFAGDGGVFAFAAGYHGSAGDIHLNRPIVGGAAHPSGDGYWLVASDGGIFSYGAAPFHGSAGGIRLNQPIVGMAVTPDGGGYWLVAADGGVFAFGNAGFHGSAGSIDLDQPMVGMAPTPDGGGYWLNAADGGVFTYGNASFHGSAA